MLPLITPSRTISPSSGSIGPSSRSTSRPPSDTSARSSRRGRPPIPPSCAATVAQPTRKSLDGLKPLEAPSTPLRPDALFDGASLAAALPAAVADAAAKANSSSSSASSSKSLSHSASAASLASESDLALLLGVDATTTAAGTAADAITSSSTPLVFGSFPPVVVQLPAADAAAAHDQQQQQPESQQPQTADSASVDGSAAATSTATVPRAQPAKPSKLSACAHEFNPQAAYLAAAAVSAATALACSASRSAAGSPEPADASSSGRAAEEAHEAAQPHHDVFAEHHEDASVAEPRWVMQQQQQAFAGDASADGGWHAWQQAQHQAAHWHAWQQAQQHVQAGSGTAAAAAVPMPVYFPVLLQPYPAPPAFGPFNQQQSVAMVPMLMPPQQQQQPADAHHAAPPLACPPSPSVGAFSNLPADTANLVSLPPTPSGGWGPLSSGSFYGGSRRGSSAGSVASFASSSRHPAVARDAGTVTVSALSCVKDAAGALAKVVTRHGSCLLLSLSKPGDQPAASTHVAAKSLAVARFYVNAQMAAAGAAGVDAAAALAGVDGAATPRTPAAASSSSSSCAGGVADEVVFVPYARGSSSGRPGLSGLVPAAAAQDAFGPDVPLGFLVAKASAADLAVALPPPVGVPACMQGAQQHPQHHQQHPQQHAAPSAAPLLKAGANTDVNKLSNAVIHNILGGGHVALQLAGAAACHVAMRALVRARDRLLRKFSTDIVATASFANEDTSSSIGRSTVFLRLDVVRSSLLQQLQAAAAAGRGAAAGAGLPAGVALA